MWQRREVVAGGALAILFGFGTECSAAGKGTPHSAGCILDDRDAEKIYPKNTDTRLFISGNEPMIPKSGDKFFDLALAQTLAKLTQLFDVRPGFAYYDDYDGHNAYAWQHSRLSGADGTVLMGTGLLQDLRKKREHPEVGVAAVCAHEFGHILQYKLGLFGKVNAGQTTVKRSELQADYFAGYFAGQRRREKSNFPTAVVALTLYRLGDDNIEDKQHHGTPAQRGAAVTKGFEASYRGQKSLSDAIQESTAYVITL